MLPLRCRIYPFFIPLNKSNASTSKVSYRIYFQEWTLPGFVIKCVVFSLAFSLDDKFTNAFLKPKKPRLLWEEKHNLKVVYTDLVLPKIWIKEIQCCVYRLNSLLLFWVAFCWQREHFALYQNPYIAGNNCGIHFASPEFSPLFFYLLRIIL